jgi:hypothetical protein
MLGRFQSEPHIELVTLGYVPVLLVGDLAWSAHRITPRLMGLLVSIRSTDRIGGTDTGLRHALVTSSFTCRSA